MVRWLVWWLPALSLLAGCDSSEETTCSAEADDAFYFTARLDGELAEPVLEDASAWFYPSESEERPGRLNALYTIGVSPPNYLCDPYPCTTFSVDAYLDSLEYDVPFVVRASETYTDGALFSRLFKGETDTIIALWNEDPSDDQAMLSGVVSETCPGQAVFEGTFSLRLRLFFNGLEEDEAGFPIPDTIHVTDGRFRLPLTVNDAREP